MLIATANRRILVRCERTPSRCQAAGHADLAHARQTRRFFFRITEEVCALDDGDALAALQVLLRARHFALSGPRRSKKPKIDVRKLLQAVSPDRPRPRPHLDAL